MRWRGETRDRAARRGIRILLHVSGERAIVSADGSERKKFARVGSGHAGQGDGHGRAIEEITAETVEVYKMIGSEIVGLAAIGLAIFSMIAGSLLFPQSRPPSESKE